MQNLGKHNIQKLLLACIMLFSLAHANGVKATVANSEIVAGNMAQLRIKVTGNKAEFPNIRYINGAEVLGRHESQNNSFTIINGTTKSEHSITLVLTFAPQKNMTIPSYEVMIDGKVYHTDPVDLKVVEPSAPNMGNNKFSLQLRSDKKTVMVGEPFLATVYFSLQHGVRLSENPQYNKPEFKGFFAKEVGEEKSYNEGKRQVTELRYILTPQSEGNFTVGPATAKIGVADRNRRDMFGRFFGTTWVPIASNTLTVEVKEKPKESDLVGSFSIEKRLDTQSVKANKPVNLTVKITGNGTLEDFEFPGFEIDGVTVYSDDAVITTDLSNNSIQSTYVKRFAFISDHDFSIPSRVISVYDTKSNTVKKLEVPSYDIKVEGPKMSTPVLQTASTSNTGKVQTNIKLPETSMLDGEEESVEPKQVEWWTTLLAFISGLMVMYLFKYVPSMKWKKKGSTANETEALKILYAHINESKEIEEMVRKLYAKKNGDKNIKIDKKSLKEMLEKVENIN